MGSPPRTVLLRGQLETAAPQGESALNHVTLQPARDAVTPVAILLRPPKCWTYKRDLLFPDPATSLHGPPSA